MVAIPNCVPTWAKRIATRSFMLLAFLLAQITNWFSYIKHHWYDRIIMPYTSSVYRADLVYLGDDERAGRKTCIYRASLLKLYIAHFIGRGQHICRAIHTTAGFDCMQQATPVAVVQQTWGGDVYITILGGEDSRLGMRWNSGRVLDVRVGGKCCNINVTDSFTWIGTDVGALTPRELVVLLVALGRLSPLDAVKVLHLKNVGINIVLDLTLDEVFARDNMLIGEAA